MNFDNIFFGNDGIKLGKEFYISPNIHGFNVGIFLVKNSLWIRTFVRELLNYAIYVDENPPLYSEVLRDFKLGLGDESVLNILYRKNVCGIMHNTEIISAARFNANLQNQIYGPPIDTFFQYNSSVSQFLHLAGVKNRFNYLPFIKKEVEKHNSK